MKIISENEQYIFLSESDQDLWCFAISNLMFYKPYYTFDCVLEIKLIL